MLFFIRGEKILQLLECFGDKAEDSVDLLHAFLISGYGASPRHIQFRADQLRKQRQKRKILIDRERQLRQRFYEMLYYLEKDGLIKRTKKDNKKMVRLTPAGRRKRQLFLNRKKERSGLPAPIYDRAISGKMIIVTFDVPERERKKRDWLRLALNNFGLKLLQKSVWIGKIKFPQEFLEDLRNLNLIQYVEIFEVSKAGSLRQIK